MEKRKIKFRAWDEDSKCFYESISTNVNYFFGINSKGLVFEKYLGKGEWRQEPLMQYTGLKDKNGKEIYEGDIVKSIANHWFIVEFGVYSTYNIGFYLHYFQEKNINYPLCGELEIMGNIYEKNI